MLFGNKPRAAAPAAPAAPDAETGVLETLHRAVDGAGLPTQAAEAARRELARLETTDPAVAEYAVGINYLEFLLKLPWTTCTRDTLDLHRAREVLDARHRGLDAVKERILEFLAARALRGAAKPKILIVDDEEIARANMAHVLGKEGYEVRTAADGLEALDILASGFVADVVVTDLKMERLDGMELLRRMRRTAPDAAVVMVTGFATVGTAVEALRAGAAHYLGKPVNLVELKKTVAEILEARLSASPGRGPVLCFSGPPGVGKTSVGQAVAEALGREFVRLSVAGLRDEAELRGHRRTYVGAMPGRILKELARIGVANPVFMLDEIDKIGAEFRGDAAAALLEILDPEQNARFSDNYLEIPFDLSRIMFISTANDVSRLPGPLLDRLEILDFPGYTDREKRDIAREFLLPRHLRENGLSTEQVAFTDAALSRIIDDYTRESGLRGLSRTVAAASPASPSTTPQPPRHAWTPPTSQACSARAASPAKPPKPATAWASSPASSSASTAAKSSSSKPRACRARASSCSPDRSAKCCANPPRRRSASSAAARPSSAWTPDFSRNPTSTSTSPPPPSPRTAPPPA